MLMPAIQHKDELILLFSKEIYTEDYYFYEGYPHLNGIPKIETSNNIYQWAIVDENKVVGYFAYHVDPFLDCADRFGLFSFDKGNPLIGIDVFKKMETLIRNHHRIEWCVVDGNPVIKHYDKLCNKHHGTRYVFHDATKDPYGHYRNVIKYEIVT